MVHPIKKDINAVKSELILRLAPPRGFLNITVKITFKEKNKPSKIIISDSGGMLADLELELDPEETKKLIQATTLLLHDPSSLPLLAGSSRIKSLFGKHSLTFLAFRQLISQSSHDTNVKSSNQELKVKYLKVLGWAFLLGQFNGSRTSIQSKKREGLSINQEVMEMVSKFLPWSEHHDLINTKNVKRCLEQFMIPIILNLRLKKEDLFLELYQDLFEVEERTSKGAFFTPPVLAERMVMECFQSRDVVLDPACGTGVFLITILNQFLKTHENDDSLSEQLRDFLQRQLHGLDIDDLAVFLTKVNLLLWLKDFPDVLAQLSSLNIHQADALFPSDEISSLFYRKFTLCIGNPPWLVLNIVDDEKRKEAFKVFAKNAGLLPSPHLITQLELSVLFLEKVKQHYMKPGGKVALILNKAILESKNHEKTRRFDELVNIKAWLFDTVVFRLPHVCLFAEFRPNFVRNYQQLKKLEIPVTFFEVLNDDDHANMQLIEKETIIHEPIAVSETTSRTSKSPKTYLVGKFLPKNIVAGLLPRGKNVYRDQCRNGASLFPRNLITIKVLNQEHVNGRTIVSFRHVIERPRKSWNFDPLAKLNMKVGRIESRYVFRVARSREIVPFALLETISVFLPMEPDETTGGYRLTTDKKSLAWQYFTRIAALYRQHAKKGASMTDLWQYLNYLGKLTTPLQRKPLRVVFAASGSKIKGFLLKDSSVIVDFKCYHVPVTNEDEGYYLLGILHAPIVSKDVIMRSGERVYHKRPLDYPIPTFDPNNELHLKISRHAQRMEKEVLSIIRPWKLEKSTESRWQPITIQRLIRTQLKPKFDQLDDFVRMLLVKTGKSRQPS